MNLINLNSTPVWQTNLSEFEEYKDQFVRAVEEYIKENPENDSVSNIGGFQSTKLFHQKKEIEPLLEVVSSMAYRACLDLNIKDVVVAVTQTWININKKGCMNAEHTHGDVLSGVFYLKLPKDENKGALILRNKNTLPCWDGYKLTESRNEFTTEVVKVMPEEGKIILFPSYVSHGVEPHFSDEDRISISFNITAIPKQSYSENQENVIQ
jgi:uncharacterized protein (TIGR02466 family)